MTRAIFIVCISLTVPSAHGQSNGKAIDSINKLSYADYKGMLLQLHIDSTRRGPSGNPKAPDAANTDESKATPYTSLPDPLILHNGKQVNIAETWWKERRAEIMEDFDREIYGRFPAYIPGVKWEIITALRDTIAGVPAITKQLLEYLIKLKCSRIQTYDQ